MSDNWLQYVPRDPEFQPAPEASERAAALLLSFLPNAESVDVEFHDEVVFFHPGANWSGVKCPACGADVESWWSDEMERASERGFSELSCVTPCCRTSTTLDQLQYVWPAAFGKYVLEAMNPNVKGLTRQQLEQLASVLGSDLNEVALHI
jgi:hypothetical protein